MQACIAPSCARIVGLGALAGRRQFMPKIASLLIVALRDFGSAILVAGETRREWKVPFLRYRRTSCKRTIWGLKTVFTK